MLVNRHLSFSTDTSRVKISCHTIANIAEKIKIDGIRRLPTLVVMEERTKEIGEIKQRVLKITEALYRTTDLFYDGEPLKWSLRQTALEVLNAASGLEAKSTYEQVREMDRIEGLVRGLFLKLELASSGTFMSRMNFEVLCREYANLLGRVAKHRGSHLSDTLLLDNSITDKKLLDNKVSDSENKREENARTESPARNEKTSDLRMEIQNGVILETDKEQGRPEPVVTERKNTLLSALKERGASSVGDLARVFSGSIGEKTIQRELNAMAAVGMIKKEGDKRWRRYFI